MEQRISLITLGVADLPRAVIGALGAGGAKKASLAQQQQLAAVIYLCGMKRGQSFFARGFQLTPGELCGTHSLRRYLSRIELMKNRFAQLRKDA